MQQAGSSNIVLEVTCNCGKNLPIKYLSLTKRTLHCSKCMHQCQGLIEYELFQEALIKQNEKRKSTVEEVQKQIEATQTLYQKIFHSMTQELLKYQEEIEIESKILNQSIGCNDLSTLIGKLTIKLDGNQEIFVEIQGENKISEIQQKLQKMNIYITNELLQAQEINKSWLTEVQNLRKTGQKVFFLDDHVLIQETDKQILILNQESQVIFQQEFQNKITGLYKSHNNKIILVKESQNLIMMQNSNNTYTNKQIVLDKQIVALIFNESSDLIIFSTPNSVEFFQLKNNEMIPLNKKLPLDKHEQHDVPILALAESNNELVTMDLLGTIKIYNLCKLENIYLKQMKRFENPGLYDFLHYKDNWIFSGILTAQIQIFQVNYSDKLINKIKEFDIGTPEDHGTIILKQDLLVQLTKDKVTVYHIKNAEITKLTTKDFESCQLRSCDISKDGTQLIITGNMTAIYNLFC